MSDYLYKEEILEHYRHPSNYGRPRKFDKSAKLHNPYCGDMIEVFLTLKTSNSASVASVSSKRCKLSFVGHGCAISMAAASMLCDFAEGKTKAELTKFSQEDMLRLVGINVSELRKKCVLLSWAAFKECLRKI